MYIQICRFDPNGYIGDTASSIAGPAVVLPRRLRYLVGVLGQELASDRLSLALESLRGGRAMPVVVDGVSTGGGAGASFLDAFLTRGGRP